MNNSGINSTWRQPIPTNLVEYCKGDCFASTILCLLLLRASNSDSTYYIENIAISLHRGQAVCGRFELSKYFGLKTSEAGRIQRVLEKMEKSYKLINKRKSLNCTIVTIHNYDDLVKMNKQVNNQQSNYEQTLNTYKTNKSERNREENPFNNTLPSHLRQEFTK